MIWLRIAAIVALAGACRAADVDLEAALGAAKWLEASGIRSAHGMVWPADPRDPASLSTSLYAGTPGPVLFFLELYRYTGQRRFLEQARAGADALLDSIAAESESGLYEGISGIGFTLGQAYEITGDARYREGAIRCVRLLRQRAQQTGRGIQWNGTTDVIAGGSGIGLFLLWADQHVKTTDGRALAIRAGERLMELGHPAGEGRLKWMMDSKFPREMPNFSHGTAGVAYFLATLYQQTHHRKFLDAALAGARYLLSIADLQGEACVIYHDSGEKKLYYLSWCHGPAGTARLFYRLYQATKDPEWLDWTRKSAQALIANGAPQRVVTPGEWNNLSVCCGVTGQAQFFADMYQVTQDRQYLDQARRASRLLAAKMTQDPAGTRWVQAEHRVRPELLLAQTGYMQGASGIGMWLLHFSAFLNHSQKPVIVFPDNPFTY